jgi:hypothetical protein
LETNAAPAVPLLVANLQSTNYSVQLFALGALIRINAHPDLCLPAINRFLPSNGLEPLFALTAISSFGPSATQWVSISRIMPCLTNYQEFTRKAATNALRQLCPEAAARFNAK